MTNALAPLTRFVAFEHSMIVDLAPVVLRDVEDLHDADLDLVLADKLADAYDAADVAIALAGQREEALDGAVGHHVLHAAILAWRPFAGQPGALADFLRLSPRPRAAGPAESVPAGMTRRPPIQEMPP